MTGPVVILQAVMCLSHTSPAAVLTADACKLPAVSSFAPHAGEHLGRKVCWRSVNGGAVIYTSTDESHRVPLRRDQAECARHNCRADINTQTGAIARKRHEQ